MPASTVTVRSAGSYSTTRSRPVVSMIRSRRRGGMPRSSWVPPPTGATAWPASSAALSAAATSSAVAGETVSDGERPSIWMGVVTLTAGALPADGAAAAGEQLEAAPGGWEHLARIAQSGRVEGVLQLQHLAHVFLAEDEWHQVFLLHANAVLARERAACRRAHVHDLGAGVDHPLLSAGLVGVPHDQWVQVAVAGMKHVGDAEARLARDLLDARQGGGQLRARNDAVDRVVVRRQAADGGEGALTAGPQRRALGLVARQPDGQRMIVTAHLLDGLGLRLDF